METYWDLEPKDRALLAEERVEQFAQIELMQKGVASPTPPQPVGAEAPELTTQKFYAVSAEGQYGAPETFNVRFASVADAEAFMACGPLVARSDYTTGVTYAMPAAKMAIAVEHLPTLTEVNNHAAALTKAEANKKGNATAQAAYDKCVREAKDATKDLWEDWRTCRGKLTYFQKIAATRDEYIELCKGDKHMALGFLAKAFPPEDCKEAEEWLNSEEEGPADEHATNAPGV